MAQEVSAAQWGKSLKVRFLDGPIEKNVESNLSFGGLKNH
jgi:hypothetical protein